MSIDLNTYITKPANNGTTTRRYYKTNCDKCGKETAYHPEPRYRMLWTDKPHLCRSCSSKEHTLENGRKPAISTEKISGSNHYSWKGGKPHCVDCGKEIDYKCKRCRSCNKKFSLGPNHPSYKGEISTTPIIKLLRTCAAYTEWIKAVLKRDNYTCQYTGQYGGKLHVHHLVPLAGIIKEAQKLYINKTEIVEYVLSKHTLDLGITVSQEYHHKVLHSKVKG